MIWLLDTNTIIYALKYQGGVRERINLAGLRGEQLVTSAVVAAELLYGAERSARRDENRKEVYKALSGIKPLPFTLSLRTLLAQEFGHAERHLLLRLAFRPEAGLDRPDSRRCWLRAADRFFEHQAFPNFHMLLSPATLAGGGHPWRAQT